MLVLGLIVGGPAQSRAQQTRAGDTPAPSTEVVSLASPGTLARLLPETLAGFKATTEIRQVTSGNIGELAADKSGVFREYLVLSAISREYAGARVDVFETRNEFAALGLFTFNSAAIKSKPVEIELGSGGARSEGEVLFWKGNIFVRIHDANPKPARGRSAVYEAIARAVADSIVPASSSVTRPPLLDSLPAGSLVPHSQRYVLGPEALSAFVDHAREMFEFVGETEAVVGEYSRVTGENSGNAQPKQSDNSLARSQVAAPASPTSPLRLVIIECHTPEFATDELARITGYVSALPEVEQQKIVFKRTGNYIVAGVNVDDKEFAEGLINSVQYPYTVKWLRNPLWPTNDPFRTQKAAEMLLSTFGLLGLILLTVLIGGTIFGTSVFLKRRKQQREIFSDAGGMLRLDIEPFALALPPKRSEE